MGQRETGRTYLEQSARAFRRALEERTLQRGALDSASTQNGLGNALFVLGVEDDNEDLVKEAATAYEKALALLETDGPAHYRGIVQTNLDDALNRLGKPEK